MDLNSGYNLSNGFFNRFIDKVFNVIKLFLGKDIQGEWVNQLFQKDMI